ncbi:hypothetical protein TIFTF001_016516 [Ficus carica]|uniref:Uncharacterized protein n=1 Tax=Ficus carica TaxID=3494 RepID=A0AA88A7P4_FICCA|nr:hypothetical protein TIFTF001_016516 [Ficus carica]
MPRSKRTASLGEWSQTLEGRQQNEQMEEKCQEMAERQTELENLLVESKKQNKEFRGKGKAREERGHMNLEEVDSEEINIRTVNPDEKEKKKLKERKEKKTMAGLMNVKMKLNESLKAFLERFTRELNQVEAVDERVVANIFKDGLVREHELHQMLKREPPKCMADVILKAEGSIRAE